jgi:hypothetical protein
VNPPDTADPPRTIRPGEADASKVPGNEIEPIGRVLPGRLPEKPRPGPGRSGFARIRTICMIGLIISSYVD